MSGMQFSDEDIKRLLPHRKPFLFVDRAEISGDMTKARTTHLFLPGEPYFEGHFPDDPIVPGVVLLECLAQSAHLLLCARAGCKLPGFLVGVESAKFNLYVRPNQTVRFEVQLLRETGELASGASSGRIFTFKATGYLDGERCLRSSINIYQTAAPPLQASEPGSTRSEGSANATKQSSPI